MMDITGFQRDFLYVIAGSDSPHGLAIKDELDTYYEKESNMVGCIRISTRSSKRVSSKRGKRLADEHVYAHPAGPARDRSACQVGNTVYQAVIQYD
jgi:hypothetical protein